MNSELNTQHSKQLWLQLLLITLIALLPRITGLDDFYTIDEAYHWPGRVERFSNALANRDWAATNQTGHPGVTTMWLGALGRQLAFARGMSDPGWAGGGAGYLAMLRLPLACVNTLAVMLGFLLLRRLIPHGAALLGAVLWATSPFLIAHSRLLHLDALLTSFMTLSILALLVRGQETTRLRDQRTQTSVSSLIIDPSFLLIISACFGGLALITKAPSLILLPFIGLLLFIQQARNQNSKPQTSYKRMLLRLHNSHSTFIKSFSLFALWLGMALLTAWLLWPAMWLNPLGSIESVMREIIDNGGQPHHSGNYFLGQALADPGPLFYPAVMLLRSTPLSLIGLLLALGLAGWQLLRRKWHIPGSLLALLCFCLLFMLLMSVQAKKLDRYLLPIWPSLEIIAAYGLWSLWAKLVSLKHSLLSPPNSYSPTQNVSALQIGAVLIQGWQLLNYAPYYMSYYNPLAGGGPTAEYVMMVGLGEGMDQVGAWLKTRPDLQRGYVLSWIPPTLAPFVSEQVPVRDLRTEYLDKASSYAVLYVRSVQHKENAIAEMTVRANPVLHSIQIHGITFATIHQLPRPFDSALDAQFGDDLALLGFSQQQLGSTLVITPSWSVLQDRSGGIVSFVHVIDQTGQTIARVDAALDQGMFPSWQAGQKFDSPLPIALPFEQSASAYRIVLGVYQPDGTRLPLTKGRSLPVDIDGPHVVELLPNN